MAEVLRVEVVEEVLREKVFIGDYNVKYTYVTRNSLGFLVCPSAMAVIGKKTNNMQDRKADIFFSVSPVAH